MNNYLGENNPIWEQGFGNLSWLYSIFIVTGVLATISAAAVSMTLKKIPLKEFMHSIYIIIPIGIIGGSIFGKAGTNINWYRLVFFWEPGLSIFAALLFGATAGFAWFWRKRYLRKISLWVYADNIVPHILLGQAIGRWGNLFNHEILGSEINIDNYMWLPSFIWQRLFYFYDVSTGERLTELVYRQPLFLYESVATFFCWIIIVFLVPLFFKLINKKPWKLDAAAFPTKKNPLEFNQIKQLQSYFEIEYQKVPSKDNEKNLFFLSKKNIWKKAYFTYEVDEAVSNNLQAQINLHRANNLNALKKIRDEKAKLKYKLDNEKDFFSSNKITKKEYKSNKKRFYSEFKIAIKKQKQDSSKLKNFWFLNSKELSKVNNPYNLKIMRCGFQTSLYILFYSLIRIILDSFRNAFELPLRNAPIANYVMISLVLIFGIVMAIFSQFIAPNKWREEGWLYEKSY